MAQYVLVCSQGADFAGHLGLPEGPFFTSLPQIDPNST